MSADLDAAREALVSARLACGKIEDNNDRVLRYLDVGRAYLDLHLTKAAGALGQGVPAAPTVYGDAPAESNTGSNNPEEITSPGDLGWDAVYRDNGGKHASQWRIIAVQADTGDVIMRDWLGGRIGYGVMVIPWDHLVEDHGPITFSHYLAEEKS